MRGDYVYGSNNYPIQSYYLRVVDKDENGQLINRLVEQVFDQYQDVYVDECKL